MTGSDAIMLGASTAIWLGILAYIWWRWTKVRHRVVIRYAPPDDEAVIIRIHGASIGDRYKTRAEYENFVDRLQWALGNYGQVREQEAENGAITITILGESAEAMYEKLGKVIRHSSTSANARVTLRFGPPGSPERQTHMAN